MHPPRRIAPIQPIQPIQPMPRMPPIQPIAGRVAGRVARFAVVFLAFAGASAAAVPPGSGFAAWTDQTASFVHHPLAGMYGHGALAGTNARPLELSLGERWNLAVLPAAPGAPERSTSRLTYRFNGGTATFTRGTDTAYLDPAGALPRSLMSDPAQAHEQTVQERRQLRAALTSWLRAGGGIASAFELGTDSTHYLAHGRLGAFPTGSGFSRAIGLDLVSIRLDASGDGHLRLGRKLGPDLFVTLEPALGASEDRARLQYRLANWLELRVEAGEVSRRIEMVAELPLR
jgi:hypothetical protein